MLNILINAYAVSPDWGSEQGMGWNWVKAIAKHCRVFVITEGQWKEEIEKAVSKLACKDNVSFHYLPVSERVRRMCWNQGDWRFYIHYAIWQRKALTLARQIMSGHHIDIIHQLNMVGFREPGFLWKIQGIPFVWGPIAGAQTIRLDYLSDETLPKKAAYRLKNLLNRLQFSFSPRVSKALYRSRAIITPIQEMEKMLKGRVSAKVLLIPESGLDGDCVDFNEMPENDRDCLDILWVGRFIRTKQLSLALEAVARIPEDKPVRFHIVGFGSNTEEKHLHDLAEKLGVENKCIWYGKTANSEVKEMMKCMDVLLFTSIYEVTSTVVPEAIQARLPIICHDMFGFGPLVSERVGWKIPCISPEESIRRFGSILSRLATDKTELKEMKRNFDPIGAFLNYDAKGKAMFELYSSMLEHKKQC